MALRFSSDPEVREKVRSYSGLGASQTAEVAYLDKEGLSYVEHDIREFEILMGASGITASWAANPPPCDAQVQH